MTSSLLGPAKLIGPYTAWQYKGVDKRWPYIAVRTDDETRTVIDLCTRVFRGSAAMFRVRETERGRRSC